MKKEIHILALVGMFGTLALMTSCGTASDQGQTVPKPKPQTSDYDRPDHDQKPKQDTWGHSDDDPKMKDQTDPSSQSQHGGSMYQGGCYNGPSSCCE